MFEMIRVSDCEFQIQNKIFSGDTAEVFVALEVNSQRKFILNKIVQSNSFIDDFILSESNLKTNETENNSCFFFSWDDVFFIAFPYYDGVDLDYYLSIEQSDDEILFMLEKLILSAAELINQNSHIHILLFFKENIVITESGNVEFNISFCDQIFKRAGFSDYSLDRNGTIHDLEGGYKEHLGDIIMLFQQKLSKYKAQQIQILADECRYGIFDSLIDVAYQVKQIRLSEEEGYLKKIEPYTLRFKRIVLFLVKLLLIVFMIYYGIKFFSSNSSSSLQSTKFVGSYSVNNVSEAVLVDKSIDYNYEEYQRKHKEREEVQIESKPEPMDDGFTVYAVKKGDTLHKISILTYGTPKYIDFIAEYNDIEDKNLISPNQMIKLPNHPKDER